MADRASKRTLPRGVRLRNGAVQIYFERNKKTYNITVSFPANKEGIKAASKLRSELIRKAEWNLLTEKDIAEARGFVEDEDTVVVGDGTLFQDLAQKYLNFNETGIHTRKGYKSILKKHWMRHFALKPIHTITEDDIKNAILKEDFKTVKTLNNCLTPLRGIFEIAKKGSLIKENPMLDIENRKLQIGIPDPFSRAEMNALLTWLSENLKGDEIFYYYYFEVAFWTGCRPSELIALRWSDIDWFNSTVRISKARVRGIEKSSTKTHVARDVILNTRSENAFKNILALGLSQDYVMICPNTKVPFNNEKAPRVRLQAAMKACMIRQRPAYNARHTYATMMLMDGLVPMFVANQMGHSLERLVKRYAKWMNGEKNKLEIAKLNTN